MVRTPAPAGPAVLARQCPLTRDPRRAEPSCPRPGCRLACADTRTGAAAQRRRPRRRPAAGSAAGAATAARAQHAAPRTAAAVVAHGGAPVHESADRHPLRGRGAGGGAGAPGRCGRDPGRGGGQRAHRRLPGGPRRALDGRAAEPVGPACACAARWRGTGARSQRVGAWRHHAAGRRRRRGRRRTVDRSGTAAAGRGRAHGRIGAGVEVDPCRGAGHRPGRPPRHGLQRHPRHRRARAGAGGGHGRAHRSWPHRRPDHRHR